MNVALIPVRGGSKSIPYKNIKYINGKPLIFWTLKAASECKYIDAIYVATEDSKIKKTVEEFHFKKAKVITRSHESASDTASTEIVMLEFAEQYDFDNIVLIQATSPLLTALDLNQGFEKMCNQNIDSVLSVVEQKRFIWKNIKDGSVKPQNYDVYYRPRRQDFEGVLVENGAFYITKKDFLIKYKSRISGNIGAVRMPENTYFEIDEPEDFTIIETLMKIRDSKKVRSTNIQKIKLFLTDCDGCLTDGGMYISDNGCEIKKFNAQDGKGLQLLRESDVKTGIITGETSNLINERARKLKIDYLKMGIVDKKSIVCDLCEEMKITPNQVAYVGDDINDLEVINMVGVGCCVNNAMECVKNIADYISPYSGGSGAVRDCIEHLYRNNLI